MEIKDLYNLDETIAKPYLEKYKYPWEVLSNIKDIIIEIGNNLDSSYTKTDENSHTLYINGTAVFGGVEIK